jgi:GH15 family glucan-1,4-alpha-glucosidase
MSNYPLIADHGLIGNLQTTALVSTDGTIDWFCSPRFDSPSIFGSLLDHDHGGHFTIRPTAETFTRRQLYYPDTAILVTRFLTESGVGEVVDFMPVTGGTVVTDRHQLVRMIRCVRGEMTFALDIAPRFDYGRESHQVHALGEDGVAFESANTALSLRLVRGTNR